MPALFGSHLHTAPSNLNITDPFLRQGYMLQKLQAAGGTAARLDTNWNDTQLAPTVVYNANANSLGSVAYDTYLTNRGYGTNGSSISWAYAKLKQADDYNISAIWNQGVIPDWAKQPRSNFPAGALGDKQWNNSLANTSYVGEFLADLIVYTSKQIGGFDVLKNVTGWQLFNEVNNTYGPNSELMLPYNEYFSMVEKAMVSIRDAYASINWTANGGGLEPPDVIGPALGGTYNPSFWDALNAYDPVDNSVQNAAGNLDLQSVSLHPYGARVDGWLDPNTGAGVSQAVANATSNNFAYHKLLLPTEDRLTWAAMAARDTAVNTPLNLQLFSSQNSQSLADQYFDLNTEVGVERTMARFKQEGYNSMEINFTEWGASTYRGNLADGVQSLWNTTFADPYKYGSFAAGTILTQGVAENLQAETVVQTIGLIESWDFVTAATVYEMFDQVPPANAGSYAMYQSMFGMAYAGLDANQQPVYKPAGLAYNAYMAGTEFHLKDISGFSNNIGVDIHIAAVGTNGTFNASLRDVTAHEVVLLREGNDVFDGQGGDDTIFGGAGNDSITGGIGYDKLYGGDGDDIVIGGTGADKIKGDAGNDTLTGGTGSGGDGIGDQFVFAAYSASGGGFSGFDTVTDFEVAYDKLSFIGGYNSAVLLNNSLYPDLVQDVSGGVRIYFADSGAYVFLQNVYESQLSATNFYVLEADTTIGFAPPTNSTITGTAGNDTLNGTATANLIYGLAGADLLYGLDGNDQLFGGDGDDWLIGGTGADVLDGGLNWDTVDYSSSAVAVTVNLSTGIGSGGDAQGDTYLNVEVVGGSSFNDTITGSNGFNSLWGAGGNDSIFGQGGDDNIDGMTGNDWLIGGAGADTINGGADWDLVDYYASATAVNVNLTTGVGTGGDAQGDVISNVETLGGSAFNDTLTGSNTGNNIWGGDGDDNINGADGDDMIDGGAGADTLNGGTGNDSMLGGIGNDTYIVDSTTDAITELTGAGTDNVQASVTIAALAANVENLTLTGTSAINATGNSLANVITGNSGNNVLNGGSGIDTLLGGNGNDTYVVDTTTDIVTETTTGGTDTVQSSVTFSLGLNVENLTLTGTASINATGNTLANVILGNSGNNYLVGGAGADTINGGDGLDFAEYYSSASAVTVNLSLTTAQSGGDAAGDVLSNIESVGGSNAGNDILIGNAGANGLWGNGGNDTLTGGGGNDTLSGASGNDTFVFATGFGVDQVNDFSAGVGVTDRLRLLVGTSFDTYAEVYAATTQVGANAVITIGVASITLLNVQKTTLVSDDFLFV